MAHPKRNLHPQTHSASSYPDPAELDPRLVPVMQLARACDYEADHTLHVTHLALRLFDDLQALHGLGAEERYLLQCAGLLHDIGWVEGWRGHHKASLAIILRTPLLLFSGKERLVIGSITRYHRKALPDKKHDNFAALDPAEKKLVKTLSALLRLADGLDRNHQLQVRDVDCQISDEQVTLICKVTQPAEDERISGLEKADLFTKVFKRKLAITWGKV